MKDDAPTAPADVDAPLPRNDNEPRVRVLHSEADDPATLERVITALADVLSGRVG